MTFLAVPELALQLMMVLFLRITRARDEYQVYGTGRLPESGDEGTAAFYFDYNLYASQYDPHGGDDSQNISTYGTLGFNLGAWRLRSDYQYNQNFRNGESTGSDSSLARTYPRLDQSLRFHQK